MTELTDRKVIRNRAVTREVDPHSALELRWYILVGFIFAALVCAYNWQQHRMVDYGYRIEALKKETAQLEEARRKLFLEQAQLRAPGRIYELAQQRLGLATPQAHQIIFENMTVERPEAAASMVAWDVQTAR